MSVGTVEEKLERRHLKDHSLRMHKSLPVIEKHQPDVSNFGCCCSKETEVKKSTKYILCIMSMHLSLQRLTFYCKTIDGLLDTALSNHWTTGQ